MFGGFESIDGVFHVLDLIDLVDDKEQDSIYAPLRDRSNPFHEFSDSVFKRKFRFSKISVHRIAERLNLGRRDNRGLPIPIQLQVLIALRFFQIGSLLKVVKDLGGNIEQSTACRSVHAVSRALATHKNEAICFPRNLNEVKEGFSSLTENVLPDVIGALDATLIKVKNPGGPDRRQFFCQRQFYAVNVQFVCDANTRILNIVARWPGNTTDLNVFLQCSLAYRLENGHMNGYLLGDNSYLCQPYLLTPVLFPMSNAEFRYNEVHNRQRSAIDRMLTALKTRFPCLQHELKLKIENALTVILATAILHNWALEFNDDIQLDELYEDECLTNGLDPDIDVEEEDVARRSQLIGMLE